MAGYRVAVVGAPGLVGRTILQVLEERDFPVSELIPLASARSAGTRLSFQGSSVAVSALSADSFAGCDLAFFSAGASVSREFAPIAARHCTYAIDNSSAFRMDPTVPLVVPEVNERELNGYRGIVANPNCSTAQMVVALQPLHEAFELESVVVSTYQSVSGTGEKGVRALDHEIEKGGRSDASPYPRPIAFNAIPQVGPFDADGWCEEEKKMIDETRKIMGLPELHVVPTTVRVPVRVGHSESVYLRFRREVDMARARRALATAPGLSLCEDAGDSGYPTALDCRGRDEVFVGRLRADPDDSHALALWVVADNLRKGAATNAVQIAEAVVGGLGQRERQQSYA